jgi:acid phosphatase (class A)
LQNTLCAAALLSSIAAVTYAAVGSDEVMRPGYFTAESAPDTIGVVTAPPPFGSMNESRDRAVFLATRAAQGSPRWALAATDAVQSSTALTADFFCSIGMTIDPAKAPALTRLLQYSMNDAASVTNHAKNFYKRDRPFVLYGGPICTEDQRDGLMKSASYPSGHTTASWSYGLILAELFPDKASAILARARSYGESRVICGVHTVSDIEAGRVNASAVIAALHGNPGFQADLGAAKAEVAALRRSPPPLGDRSATCPAEFDAAANRPW